MQKSGFDRVCAKKRVVRSRVRTLMYIRIHVYMILPAPEYYLGIPLGASRQIVPKYYSGAGILLREMGIFLRVFSLG